MTFALLFTTAAIVGCSKSPPPIGSAVEESVRGMWKSDRTYTNDFFGISLSVPSEWKLLKGDEANLEFVLKSIGAVSGGNRAAEDAFRKQSAKIHVPMRTLLHSDSNDVENPNVLVMIENIEGEPTIETGGDFLTKMESLMNSSPQLPKFDGPPTQTNVNGVDIWTRSSTLDVNGGEGVLFSGAGGYTCRQRGYSVVRGHFALTILCTWFSSSDEACSDFVAKHLAKVDESAEQAGADQPATARESKSEGKEKPQPESKPAPR